MTSQFCLLATFLYPKNDAEVFLYPSTKGAKRPYYVPGQKQARLMKAYLLSERCADLVILITGGLKPEYYIRKRIL